MLQASQTTSQALGQLFPFKMLVLTAFVLILSISSSSSYIWEQPKDPYLRYQYVPPISRTTRRFSRYFMGIGPTTGGLRTKRGPGTPQPSDVVFVLDSSSSVGRKQFLHEVKAIHTIIKRSSDNNKYAVVVFSTDAFIKLNFTDRMTALRKVTEIPYVPGKSNIQKGLLLAKELFLDEKSNLSKGVPKKVLLITDGLSNVKQELTLYRSFQLKMMGAQIYVIATGRFMYGAPETLGLATSPFRHFYRLYNMKAFLKSTRMIPFLPIRQGQRSSSDSVA